MPETDLAIIPQTNPSAISNYTSFAEIAPQPSQEALKRLSGFNDYARACLTLERDYGQIPGTDGLSLFLSGAEKLCAGYKLRPSYEILPSSIADHKAGLFHYDVRCVLHYQQWDVGEGLGTCNSREKKYAYRWVDTEKLEAVPELHHLRGAALEQRVLKNGKILVRVPQWEVADLANTILQMASKRALVKAVRSTFGLSAYGWTSDIGDTQSYADDAPHNTAYFRSERPKPASKKKQPATTTEALDHFRQWLDSRAPDPDSAFSAAMALINTQFPDPSGAAPFNPDLKPSTLAAFLNEIIVPDLRTNGIIS